MSSIEKQSLKDIVAAYGRFVPEQFLSLLGKKSITEVALGDSIEQTMTVLFSDIRNFTSLSESMTPQQNFAFLNSFLGTMEPVLYEHRAVIDKYIGDAVMALFPEGADSAVRGSIAMLKALVEFNVKRDFNGDPPLRIGIGLNTGVMMLGTVGGSKRMDGTVISDAVNLAARIESLSKTYGAPLLISEHTLYSLEDPDSYHIRFIDRVRVKGKLQPESVYEVYDADPADVLSCKDRSRRAFEEGVAHYHFKNIAQAEQLLSQCIKACDSDEAAKVYLERCERFQNTGVHESTGEVDLNLEWDPALEIAHHEIDEQHRYLFACAKDFVQTIQNCDDYSQVLVALGSLSQALEDHFKDEEQYMADAGYPFLDRQKKQHARFGKYFVGLKNEIERDLADHRLYILFRMQVLVVDWLINHTGGMDRHFGKYLRLMKQMK